MGEIEFRRLSIDSSCENSTLKLQFRRILILKYYQQQNEEMTLHNFLSAFAIVLPA
jgi:hypothetical protein